MKSSEAKELFRQFTAGFFGNSAMVIFSKQSRIAKPELDLVSISPGNVSRPNAPNYTVVDGCMAGHYLSKLPITVDLFTKGRPYKDKNGNVLYYENTAIEEISNFVNYINSAKTVEQSYLKDVTFVTEGDIIDLTEIVNDNNYEYRARIVIDMYFTEVLYGFNGTAESIEEAKKQMQKEYGSKEAGWFNEAELIDVKEETL